MPVGIRLDFENVGLGDYDAVCRTLNFPSDWPDGLLAHGSADVDGRLVVTDVWETRQHFDRFVDERLGSAMGETVGDRGGQPQITEVQLHTFYGKERS